MAYAFGTHKSLSWHAGWFENEKLALGLLEPLSFMDFQRIAKVYYHDMTKKRNLVDDIFKYLRQSQIDKLGHLLGEINGVSSATMSLVSKPTQMAIVANSTIGASENSANVLAKPKTENVQTRPKRAKRKTDLIPGQKSKSNLQPRREMVSRLTVKANQRDARQERIDNQNRQAAEREKAARILELQRLSKIKDQAAYRLAEEARLRDEEKAKNQVRFRRYQRRRSSVFAQAPTRSIML